MENQNNQGKLLVQLGVKKTDIKIVTISKIQYNQGGFKLQARTLAVLPHSLVGHSMTYDVPKILKRIRHLK
jgi:Tfp pilus assembly PilM family ATPase